MKIYKDLSVFAKTLTDVNSISPILFVPCTQAIGSSPKIGFLVTNNDLHRILLDTGAGDLFDGGVHARKMNEEDSLQFMILAKEYFQSTEFEELTQFLNARLKEIMKLDE